MISHSAWHSAMTWGSALYRARYHLPASGLRARNGYRSSTPEREARSSRGGMPALRHAHQGASNDYR